MVRNFNDSVRTSSSRYRRLKKSLAVFAYSYDGRAYTKELEKNRTLLRFDTRVKKDMERESQGYMISNRCPRNNTSKV